MIKPLVRKVVPPALWNRLRLLRLRSSVARFRPREVHHVYGGFPLRVLLADPLGQGWYDSDWPVQPEIALLQQHRLRDGARVFDLGAHHAVVALMLARIVGPTGQVVAVEANRHNAEVCRRNRELNDASQLEVVHAAISDQPGTILINEGLNGQVDDGQGGWGQVEVPAVTIDELARRHGPPDILFIDVEGFECHALRGAGETMARRPDCYVEVHVGLGLEKFGGSVAEVLSYFPASDYDLQVASEAEPTYRPWTPDSPLQHGRFFLVATSRRPETASS